MHQEVANSSKDNVVPHTPPLRRPSSEIPEEVVNSTEEILIPGIPPWRRLSAEIPSDVRILFIYFYVILFEIIKLYTETNLSIPL